MNPSDDFVLLWKRGFLFVSMFEMDVKLVSHAIIQENIQETKVQFEGAFP